MKDGEAFNTVMRAIKAANPVDYAVVPLERRDRRFVQVFIRNETGQSLIDNIQTRLENEKDWRLTVISIEATSPAIKEETYPGGRKKTKKALREEIYTKVADGGEFGTDFAVLVVLSTIVAAIGLNSNSVAGVIGAMVIAPLLGPILAFTFGVALGDTKLLTGAGLTLIAGITIALVTSILISWVVPLDLSSRELVSRAEVRLDGVALAMAAGGAAALSIARGAGTVLVGVMVAAALLPPGAAVGLFIGDGLWGLAGRSALLLSLNIASLILSALIVFRWKGIRPRSWIEQKDAQRSMWINAGLSSALLVIAIVLIIVLDLGQKISFGG